MGLADKNTCDWSMDYLMDFYVSMSYSNSFYVLSSALSLFQNGLMRLLCYQCEIYLQIKPSQTLVSLPSLVGIQQAASELIREIKRQNSHCFELNLVRSQGKTSFGSCRTKIYIVTLTLTTMTENMSVYNSSNYIWRAIQ